MPALTPKQEDQLNALLAAGATSRESAVSIHSGLTLFNNMLCGKLRDLGLARSRVARPPGGSQRTEYWLTDEGVEIARRLAQEVPSS